MFITILKLIKHISDLIAYYSYNCMNSCYIQANPERFNLLCSYRHSIKEHKLAVMIVH